MEPMDHDAAMRKLGDLLARMKERADTVAIGVAIAYEDGSTASFYESAHDAALLGSITMLEARILSDNNEGCDP